MPRLLKTLTEYVATIRKRETYFMVFNTVYNDIYAFGTNKILLKMEYLDI